MFTSFLSVSAILLAASLVSAASLPEARTTFDVCAICPSVDTEGNTLSPISNFGLTPPEKFCGYALTQFHRVWLLTVILATGTLEQMDLSPAVSMMYALVKCSLFNTD